MRKILPSAENNIGVAQIPPYQEVNNTMVNVSDEGQVFECEICGNTVEVLEVGGGELVCCGEPMALKE